MQETLSHAQNQKQEWFIDDEDPAFKQAIEWVAIHQGKTFKSSLLNRPSDIPVWFDHVWSQWEEWSKQHHIENEPSKEKDKEKKQALWVKGIMYALASVNDKGVFVFNRPVLEEMSLRLCDKWLNHPKTASFLERLATENPELSRQVWLNTVNVDMWEKVFQGHQHLLPHPLMTKEMLKTRRTLCSYGDVPSFDVHAWSSNEENKETRSLQKRIGKDFWDRYVQEASPAEVSDVLLGWFEEKPGWLLDILEGGFMPTHPSSDGKSPMEVWATMLKKQWFEQMLSEIDRQIEVANQSKEVVYAELEPMGETPTTVPQTSRFKSVMFEG